MTLPLARLILNENGSFNCAPGETVPRDLVPNQVYSYLVPVRREGLNISVGTEARLEYLGKDGATTAIGNVFILSRNRGEKSRIPYFSGEYKVLNLNSNNPS